MITVFEARKLKDEAIRAYSNGLMTFEETMEVLDWILEVLNGYYFTQLREAN